MPDLRPVLLAGALSYLTKQAQDPDIQTNLLTLGGGIGAALAATLGASLLHKSLDQQTIEAFRGLPSATPRLVQRLKHVSGLDGLVSQQISGLGNAYYLPSRGLNPEEKQSLIFRRAQDRARGNIPRVREVDALLAADESPVGGIFYGDKWNNPYTIAHEMGHALAANESQLRRYVEKAPGVLDKLFGLGALAGVAVGAARPDWLPQIGLGLAGLGALSTAASAYTEGGASQKALDLLRGTDYKPTGDGQRALTLAERSHVWPKLGVQVLAPLALAGVSKLIQNYQA